MKKEQSNDRLLCAGLNDAAKQIHEDAKRKGFWDSERETETLLMLCMSKLSEALEADRKNRHANVKCFESVDNRWERPSHDVFSFEANIKDTFEDKLADTVIRILDLCGARGIDIEKHINLKLEYNRLRERMHGKAYKVQNMETFRFGKYKGLTYEEVRKKSPSYFTWLWFNIKEKLDKPLYDYIETNLKELKKEADNEHAVFMYHYCNGEVAPEY
jgi:NTP pyrophosphatase (non-canonical NTP hydrolase)